MDLATVLGAAVVTAVGLAYYRWIARKVWLYFQQNALSDRLQQLCPSVFARDFQPTPWLLNGHFQTIYLAVSNQSQSYASIKYERQSLDLPDGGYVTLDWSLAPPGRSWVKQTPTVVVLHGLTGGSQEGYVKSVIEESHKRGLRCVVFNARGCAGAHLKTPQFYCASYTEDLRYAVAAVRAAIPDAPLAAVGFSLGSNILVKYLGEEGSAAPLLAGVSVGNPFDLMCSMRNLDNDFFMRNTYSRYLAFNLKNAYLTHREAFASHPVIDDKLILDSSTIREFDDRITRRIFGYKSVNEYYQDGSSNRYVAFVDVPMLVLNALNDPISVGTAIPIDECANNPLTTLCVTAEGGHLGWHEGFYKPKHWSSRIIADYLAAIFEMEERNELKPIVSRLREQSEAFRSSHVSKALSGHVNAPFRRISSSTTSSPSSLS